MTKYGFATGESLIPPKKQQQINEHNEHHLLFVLAPSALPLHLQEKRCTGTSQPSPVGGGGAWFGDVPCSNVFFWITPDEDQVGHLHFYCFLLSLSGISLEEDCTGSMPTETEVFFRQHADLALRWHEGQCWQLKRNYDLQDLVWMIPCI
jgi:hypothetical protein